VIPGDHARRYLDRIAPRRVDLGIWPFLYGALTFLALVLIGLSALIPQTGSREEARHMGFGEPTAFVYADARMRATGTTPTKYYFNPMEDPATVSHGRFFLAWGVAILLLVGPVWLIRWLWMRGRSQLVLER
jgi:hypothetical protein